MFATEDELRPDILASEIWREVFRLNGEYSIRDFITRIMGVLSIEHHKAWAIRERANKFINLIVDNEHALFKPPRGYYDCDGREILSHSWVHPLDLRGENVANLEVRLHISSKMYVGAFNARSRRDYPQNLRIPRPNIVQETTVLLVPPILMPVLYDQGSWSLYERRLAAAIENLREVAIKPAIGDEAYHGDRTGWFKPLPVEVYGYDDSRNYADARFAFRCTHEPFDHFHPRGEMGLTLLRLNEAYLNLPAGPQWWCHDHTVERRRTREAMMFAQAVAIIDAAVAVNPAVANPADVPIPSPAIAAMPVVLEQPMDVANGGAVSRGSSQSQQ